MNPETPITLELIDEVLEQIQFHKDVSPRLLYRILRWSQDKIRDNQAKLNEIKKVLEESDVEEQQNPFAKLKGINETDAEN